MDDFEQSVLRIHQPQWQGGKVQEFLSHTLIPDEGFFPTVLMNTNYSGTLVNDDKRAIVWIPDEGIKLLVKTLMGRTLNL